MSANQKRVWPELVGKDANSAMKTLKEESSSLKYQSIDRHCSFFLIQVLMIFKHYVTIHQ
jgi:hypothetical protein